MLVFHIVFLARIGHEDNGEYFYAVDIGRNIVSIQLLVFFNTKVIKSEYIFVNLMTLNEFLEKNNVKGGVIRAMERGDIRGIF